MTDRLKTPTLARLYLDQGHPQKAIEILKDLSLKAPGDPLVDQLLTEAQEEIDRAPGPAMGEAFETGGETSQSPALPPIGSDAAAADAKSRNVGALRKRARELGNVVVNHLSRQAETRLNRLLERVRERRR